MSATTATSTFPSEAIGLHTKRSNHPLAQLLVGSLVGAHFSPTRLTLYYGDGHKVLIEVNDDGDLTVEELETKAPC